MSTKKTYFSYHLAHILGKITNHEKFDHPLEKCVYCRDKKKHFANDIKSNMLLKHQNKSVFLSSKITRIGISVFEEYEYFIDHFMCQIQRIYKRDFDIFDKKYLHGTEENILNDIRVLLKNMKPLDHIVLVLSKFTKEILDELCLIKNQNYYKIWILSLEESFIPENMKYQIMKKNQKLFAKTLLEEEEEMEKRNQIFLIFSKNLDVFKIYRHRLSIWNFFENDKNILVFSNFLFPLKKVIFGFS